MDDLLHNHVEKVRVLVLDDDEEDFFVTKIKLERIENFAVEIQWEQDFDAASKKACSDVYDVCFVDYHLGLRHGVDFIRESYLNGLNTPMILLTGVSDHRVDVDAMRAGASDFLIKDDINPKILERSIRYAMQRRKISTELERRTYLDALTNLTNREGFKKTIQLEITRAKETSQVLMVLFIDLDGFKQVNDTMGHQVGDALLQKIATRLKNSTRQGDLVARYGGDEFVVLLKKRESVDAVEEIVRRMMTEIESPILLQGRHIQVQCSVGGAEFPKDGYDAETLIHHADAAMYRAKLSGGGDFVRHQHQSSHLFSKRKFVDSIETEVRLEDLFLMYQPQIHIQTTEVIGVEALIRWENNSNVHLPKQFLPSIEQTNKMSEVGNWVLGKVCEQLKVWNTHSKSLSICSINCSASQLYDPNIALAVQKALEKNQINGNQIEIEINEDVLEFDNPIFQRNYEKLRELGVNFSLDGFGKSKGALRLLDKISLKKIKIDQAIVRAALHDKRSQGFSVAVATFANQIGIDVIAQGIETQEQKDFLSNLGYDIGQGYYFSKPLLPNQFLKLLKNSNSTNRMVSSSS